MNIQRNKRKEAISELKKHYESFSTVLLIHYSCESFYDIKEARSPRITSIAIRNAKYRQVDSFSIHKIAEIKKQEINDSTYDSLEKGMLDDFFKFVECHKDYIWVHWNMRSINYGFKAIEHRYRVLGGTPSYIADDKKFDLGSKIIDLYSKEGFDHPRLNSIITMNNLSHRDFLVGEEEARAFENSEYIRLHQSTLRKVNIFQCIIELIMSGKLKSKAKWYHIYGVTPQGIHEFINESIWAGVIYTLIIAVIGGILVKLIGF